MACVGDYKDIFILKRAGIKSVNVGTEERCGSVALMHSGKSESRFTR